MMKLSIEKRVLAGARRVLGFAVPPVALHEPEFGERESELVLDCLSSTFVSTVGRYVGEFEEMLTAFTGAKHAVAVVNGTAALHMSLHLAGVEPGDEVIVPALSFVATANAVAHCHAIPHFVDSDLQTLGVSPSALEAHLSNVAERTGTGSRNKQTGRRLAAIVPMHVFGHAVNMDLLVPLAERWGIPIVEDAAESLGSTWRGRHLGNFGLVAALSFNGNKIVTTGGGGAVLTNDTEIWHRAKHLTTTAKRPHPWEFFHDAVAWNYRMPNLNAALGCAQLERLPEFVASKRALAERYRSAFADDPNIEFVGEPKNGCSNYWLNAIRIVPADLALRDRVLSELNDAGYQSRPLWTLMHLLPMYQGSPRAPLPVATELAASVVNLPSSAKLGMAR